MLTITKVITVLGCITIATAQCTTTCPADTQCSEINQNPSIYRCTETCALKVCPMGTTCETNTVTNIADCVGSTDHCSPCPDYTQCEFITKRDAYSCMETCELVQCPAGLNCFMNTTVGEAQCKNDSTPIPVSTECGTCPADTVCRPVGVLHRCVETCAIKNCPAQTKCITDVDGIAECIGANTPSTCNPGCQNHTSCQLVTSTNKYICMETCDLVSKTCKTGELCEMDTVNGVTKCIKPIPPPQIPSTPPPQVPTKIPNTPPSTVTPPTAGTPPTQSPKTPTASPVPGDDLNSSTEKGSGDSSDSLTWLWILLTVLGVALIGGGVGAYFYFKRKQQGDTRSFRFVSNMEDEEMSLNEINNSPSTFSKTNNDAIVMPNTIHRL